MWHNELNQEITAFEKHAFDALNLINRRLHEMAIDLTALKAAQVRIQSDVTSLIVLAQTALNASPDPTLQNQLDLITASLSTSAVAAEAELAAAAPTGTTGSTGSTAPTGTTGPTA